MNQGDKGYLYMWEYRVRPGHLDEFLEAYGPDGAWVRLFRRAEGYVRTELHRDRVEPHRFVTLDYWMSREAWQAWRHDNATDFERLDQHCERLTIEERELGTFHSCP